jgi:flagellar FliJ protein
MNRQFPLAGLLRLRKMQEDQAAAGLARAASSARSASERRAAARTELAGSGDTSVSSAALLAIAAARASSQSMLADLDALAEVAEEQLSAARSDYSHARRSAAGLEKLEDRHLAERAAADLLAEQGALDEIASTSWHRTAGEASA